MPHCIRHKELAWRHYLSRESELWELDNVQQVNKQRKMYKKGDKKGLKKVNNKIRCDSVVHK